MAAAREVSNGLKAELGLWGGGLQMFVSREGAVAERYFEEGKGKQVVAGPTQPGVWLPLTSSPPIPLLLTTLWPHWS